MSLSEKLMNYQGENPFRDYQARNYSKKKILDEFEPTSTFFSMFNDMHEIIIGTRGSGKTIILKMMRNSLLKKLEHKKARDIVQKKEYLCLYIPVRIENMDEGDMNIGDDDTRIKYFYFTFNCMVAESLITELISILEDLPSPDKYQKNNLLARKIGEMWFGNKESESINDLTELSYRVTKYFNLYSKTSNFDNVSPIFHSRLSSTLRSVKALISEILMLDSNQKWIVAIDEAEYLTPFYQKCLNSSIRSDSDGITYKIATLPFSHKTFETLVPNQYIKPNDDFNFCIIDLNYNDKNFISITNKLCSNRLKKILDLNSEVSLEDFIGKVGNDNLIDYYKLEFKKEISELGSIDLRKHIDTQIYKSLPPEKIDKLNSRFQELDDILNAEDLRKPIFDKLAPIYYLREMYKSKGGNRQLGWYAGKDYIRKASQGNPRMFIFIMSALVEQARKTKLTPKKQHKIIFEYCKNLCISIEGFSEIGPTTKKNLDIIANQVNEKVHGEYIKEVGNTFTLRFNDSDMKTNRPWIEQAVAHNRLEVDKTSKKYGLKSDSKYTLSNAYCIFNWIPLRRHNLVNYQKSIIQPDLVTSGSKQISLFYQESDCND